jgi:rubrerythrin
MRQIRKIRVLRRNTASVLEQEEIMKAFDRLTSVDAILNFCIEQEEASAKLYSDLAGMMEYPEITQLFKELAERETEHRKKFQEVKAGKAQLCVGSHAPEIEIREDLPPLSPGPHMSCQQAIGLAIKKEIIAATVYSKLAESVEDKNLRNILLAIADEETKHKHHFDTEYEKCLITDGQHPSDART